MVLDTRKSSFGSQLFVCLWNLFNVGILNVAMYPLGETNIKRQKIKLIIIKIQIKHYMKNQPSENISYI